MTTTSRAVAALVGIMRGHETSPHRRIEACEHLLDYECPLHIIEEAKAALMSVVEDGEVLIDTKLDALKLLRRVEARKVSPGRAVRGSDIETSRDVEILRRRRALRLAGIAPPPHGFDDDLTGPNYVPLPSDADVEPDLGLALRNARLARLRSVRKNPHENSE
jgi:hypothetical protein